MSNFTMILISVIIVAAALLGAGYWVYKKYLSELVAREQRIAADQARLREWAISDQNARAMVESIQVLDTAMNNAKSVFEKADLRSLDIARGNSLKNMLEDVRDKAQDLSKSFNNDLSKFLKTNPRDNNTQIKTFESQSQKPTFGSGKNFGNGNKIFSDAAKELGITFSQFLSYGKQIDPNFNVDLFYSMKPSDKEDMKSAVSLLVGDDRKISQEVR